MYIDTSTVYFSNGILYSYKYFTDDLIATVLFVFIDGAVLPNTKVRMIIYYCLDVYI
jgi:hypothetical protein